MTDKGKTLAQDGYRPTPQIATQGKVIVQNGYRPTPTVATSQGQSQSSGSGEKK